MKNLHSPVDSSIVGKGGEVSDDGQEGVLELFIGTGSKVRL